LFGQGLYKQYVVQGPLDLTLHVQKDASVTVVLSGLFLDELLRPSRIPEVLQWQGDRLAGEPWAVLRDFVADGRPDPLSCYRQQVTYRQAWREAESEWERSSNPSLEQAWLLYEAARRFGEHAVAASTAQRLTETLTRAGDANVNIQLLTLARTAYKEERFDLAEAAWRAALTTGLSPEGTIGVHEQLARLYLHLGWDDQAVAEYQTIVHSGAPDIMKVGALYHLGLINLTQKREEEAVSQFQTLSEQYPKMTEAQFAQHYLAFLQRVP